MKRLEIDYSLNSIDVLVSLARYNFVNKTINTDDLNVLDYGCGSGYGTKVLKEKFKSVTSFDTYPDDYLPPGIEVVTDESKLPKNKFDIVTCFEVIEHMGQEEQVQLISKMADFLNDTGTLFISTVRKMVPPPTENRKLHHVKELSFKELSDLCSSRFSNIYTFGQIDQIISTFNPDNQYHFVFICTGKK